MCTTNCDSQSRGSLEKRGRPESFGVSNEAQSSLMVRDALDRSFSGKELETIDGALSVVLGANLDLFH